MKLEDIRNFHHASFRHRVENFWANYKGTGKFLTLGALLATIKIEKLWERWGHDTFADYCKNELHLVPTYHENILVIAYLRLKSLGLHEDEMRKIEGVENLKHILLISKHARTKAEFLRMVRKHHASTLPEIKEAIFHPPHRKRPLMAPTDMPRSLVETMELCHATTAKFFGVRPFQSTSVMAIVTLALIEHNSPRERTVRRLARQSGLEEATARKIIDLLAGK